MESGRPRNGRVVCFGELLLRLTAPGRELLLQTPRLDVHVGGAEANVAIGLAALGHQTRMVSRVPAHRLGQAAADYLRSCRVDANGVTTGPGRMGLYFLSPGAGVRPSEIVYDREASSFALSGPEAFDWPGQLAGADLLHLSGITPALGPGPAEAALAAAAAAVAREIPVSFDGNFRAQLWAGRDGDPRAILCRLVERATILFGNHRDVSLLLGTTFTGEGKGQRRAVAQAAFDAFPRLRYLASTARVVESADCHRLSARIDSRDGFAETEEVVVPGIVDRIGAGDAFAAGVLHGLRGEGDLDEMARSGLALAALKHSLPGDASRFGEADIERFWTGEYDVRR